MMKGIMLSALMIVGILLFAGAAIGLSYAKYDEVTTTFTIEDGITCKIDGREITNGSTVTVPLKADKLRIDVESESEQFIGYSGRWSSYSDNVSSSKTDDSVIKSGTFVIDFHHGTYTGAIKIKYIPADMSGQTIIFDFTICDGVTVTSGSKEIKNGDSVQFTDDTIYIDVKTNDGQKKNISFTYWWGDAGEGGFGTGSEYASSIRIVIDNTAFFDPETGGVEIKL